MSGLPKHWSEADLAAYKIADVRFDALYVIEMAGGHYSSRPSPSDQQKARTILALIESHESATPDLRPHADVARMHAQMEREAVADRAFAQAFRDQAARILIDILKKHTKE